YEEAALIDGFRARVRGRIAHQAVSAKRRLPRDVPADDRPVLDAGLREVREEPAFRDRKAGTQQAREPEPRRSRAVGCPGELEPSVPELMIVKPPHEALTVGGGGLVHRAQPRQLAEADRGLQFERAKVVPAVDEEEA